MKFNEKYDINPEFGDLFEFKDKKQELRHEAAMVMFRFLSEIEKLSEGKMSKKELAKSLDTSASYITQLFNGDKLINLLTIAKLQDAFDIVFAIKTVPKISINFELDTSVLIGNKTINYDSINGKAENSRPFQVVEGGKYKFNRA